MGVLWPLQQAVYARLTGDATLMGLVSGVFDYMPDDTAPPYIAIGEATETPFNTLNRGEGSDATITFQVTSETKGFSKALAVTDRMEVLLNFYEITISGYDTVYLRKDNVTTMREPDGVTRRVIARYRLVAQKE